MRRQSPSELARDLWEWAHVHLHRLRKKVAALRRGPGGAPPPPTQRRPTVTLPVGALFAHDDVLYEVIERGGGYDFAQQWDVLARQAVHVALDAHSLGARFHRVIETGEPLPEVTRKVLLLDRQGRILCFVFESRRRAERVARLEAALAYRSGCRQRNVSAELIGLNDGSRNYRLFAIGPPKLERVPTRDLAGEVVVLPESDGPYYWKWVRQGE